MHRSPYTLLDHHKIVTTGVIRPLLYLLAHSLDFVILNIYLCSLYHIGCARGSN